MGQEARDAVLCKKKYTLLLYRQQRLYLELNLISRYGTSPQPGAAPRAIYRKPEVAGHQYVRAHTRTQDDLNQAGVPGGGGESTRPPSRDRRGSGVRFH